MAISPNDVRKAKNAEICALHVNQMKYVKSQERVIDERLRKHFAKTDAAPYVTISLSGWESRVTLEILRDRYRNAGWDAQLDYDEVDRNIRLTFAFPAHLSLPVPV